MRIGVEDVALELAVGDQVVNVSSVELIDKMVEWDQKNDEKGVENPFDYLKAFKDFLVSKGLRQDTSNTLVRMLLDKINDRNVAEAVQKKMLGSPT